MGTAAPVPLLGQVLCLPCRGELRKVGIKAPEEIAKPSVRNDAAFLGTTVLTTSVIAVAAGSLPGDWVRCNC